MSMHYLGRYEPRKWSFQYNVLKTTVLQLVVDTHQPILIILCSVQVVFLV